MKLGSALGFIEVGEKRADDGTPEVNDVKGPAIFGEEYSMVAFFPLPDM